MICDGAHTNMDSISLDAVKSFFISLVGLRHFSPTKTHHSTCIVVACR